MQSHSQRMEDVLLQTSHALKVGFYSSASLVTLLAITN